MAICQKWEFNLVAWKLWRVTRVTIKWRSFKWVEKLEILSNNELHHWGRCVCVTRHRWGSIDIVTIKAWKWYQREATRFLIPWWFPERWWDFQGFRYATEWWKDGWGKRHMSTDLVEQTLTTTATGWWILKEKNKTTCQQPESEIDYV